MAGVGENAAAKPPSSVAERRKARRKALIQKHIAMSERAIAGRQDARERNALVEVLAGLRRREAELDAAVDAEAWSAAHPPRKMPEARIATYRDNGEWAANYLRRFRGIPAFMAESLVWNRDHAAGLLREYEANGFVEVFEADDFGLPWNYVHLLLGWPTREGSTSCF